MTPDKNPLKYLRHRASPHTNNECVVKNELLEEGGS